MQQISNLFKLLPGYLILMAIFLVIIPTIIGLISRLFLYNHLYQVSKIIKRLLNRIDLEKTPYIIRRIEPRFQNSISASSEKINTAAIVEGSYSQERVKILGLSFSCEAIDYFTRLLPNLLLSFGLLGTFLGITINLTSLSQTITTVDAPDITSLIEELNKPLQGMGVAFLTSLIAIACSALLTVVNLLWNTNIAKSNLLSFLEDYVDNVYLPTVQPDTVLEAAIERISNNFSAMIDHLGSTIEESITTAFARMENSVNTFDKAANTFDQSRFPEKLASATNNLAIAQNSFSQSSLVLQKSTQSFENSLDSMQTVARKVLAVEEQVGQVNQRYFELIELNQQRNEIEKAGLQGIQLELTKLVDKMQNINNQL